ncbi:FimD/PapC N-terminal domain-containing protein, partial [Escherichia coli]|uniref:FimD/PapC N-terminal domain-containing protein n=1 Tax=Escherichia coli TaxID=562 RepID=UPI0024E099B4
MSRFPRTHFQLAPLFLVVSPRGCVVLWVLESGKKLRQGSFVFYIILNNGYMARRDVTFNTGDSEKGIVPCLTRAQLASMGLNT